MFKMYYYYGRVSDGGEYGTSGTMLELHCVDQCVCHHCTEQLSAGTPPLGYLPTTHS